MTTSPPDAPEADGASTPRGTPQRDGATSGALAVFALDEMDVAVLQLDLRGLVSLVQSDAELGAVGPEILPTIRILHANRALGELVGLEPAGLAGCTLSDFVRLSSGGDPCWVVARVRALVEVARSGAPRWRERLVYRDGAGALRCVMASIRLPRADEGWGRALMSLTDLTRAVLVERDLRAIEHRFRALTDTMQDMVSVHDLEGRYEYVSAACRTLLGYEPEEVHGRSAYEFIHPDDLGEMRSAHDDVVGEPSRTFIQYRLRHRDGRWVWVESAAARLQPAGGAPAQIVTTTRDLTERNILRATLERLRGALDESEERLELAISGAESAVWDWDVARDEIYYSDSYYRMLGYEPGAWASDSGTWLGLVHRDDLRTVHDAVHRYFSGTEPRFELTLRLRRATGEYHWHEIRAQVLRTETGAPRRMVGFLRSIQQKMEAALELERARADAERASAAKSTFLAMMSHELRTPLTGVMGLMDLLADGPTTPEQREILDAMRASARGLLAVVGDVLDFSRIEADRLVLRPVDFRVRELVSDLEQLHGSAASERGVCLVARVSPEVPEVLRADADRIRQVLTNLLSNALKFTERGEVRLSVTCATREGRAWLVLRVADTGIGMTPEQARACFEPFVQSESSSTRRFGGTGLGLAICRRLIEAMGGAVRMQSAPDEGTEFEVELPTQAPVGELPAPREEAQRLPRTRRPLHVLVAEDNRINQLLMRTVLERVGHRVTCAATGVEALRMLGDESFDMVLMDVQMPEMDGTDAVRVLRRLGGRAARLPVIAVSADAVTEHRAGYMEAGFDAFVTKPIDWHALSEVMDQLAAR